METTLYTLVDHIGWSMTRRIPLRKDAVSHLTTMVNKTYTDFKAQFAGITTDTSLAYIQSFFNILDNVSFYTEASKIVLGYSFLDYLEVPYNIEGSPLDETLIPILFNCLKLTNEFSGFAADLQDITPETSQEWKYKIIIMYQVMACPKFPRDAQNFML